MESKVRYFNFGVWSGKTSGYSGAILMGLVGPSNQSTVTGGGPYRSKRELLYGIVVFVKGIGGSFF